MKITSLNSIADTAVSHNEKIKKRVMLGNSEIKNITNFSQAIFPPGECAPAHSHADMSEVFFIQSGNGSIEINGKSYPLEAGSCITIEPGERHELRNTGSDNMVVIYFGVLSR